MKFDFSVQFAIKAADVPSKHALKYWVRAALPPKGGATIAVRIVDEVEGRQLNHDYRGRDYATNVLSFAFNEGETMPGVPHMLLGDLVLCAPVVAREALAQGKLAAAHWAHLLVHGVLHLRGFDHQADADAQTMEAMETQILATMGIADPYVLMPGAPDAD